MAIKINKQLTAKGGLTISSGSVVTFTPIFVDKRVQNDDGSYSINHQLHANLDLYKSKTEFENGGDKIPGTPQEFDTMGVVKNLTDSEYNSLDTDTGVLSKVEAWVQNKIENFDGMSSGDTEIITFNI